jgi:hypothetical protein
MWNVERSVRRAICRCRVLAVGVMLVLAGAAAPARAATVLSETTWGGAGSEVTNGAAIAPDGGAYLAGFTRSFDPFGQEHAFLVRFAADGSLAWQRTFDGPDQFANDRANGVAIAPPTARCT